MSPRQRFITIILTMLLATGARAQTPPGATIGIYFDPAANFEYYMMTTAHPLLTYVCATRAESMIGGAAFRVEMPTWIQLLSETFPAGLPIGDLMTGVELGLTTPLPVFGTDAAVLATFVILPPDYPFATLEILPHPSYATPVLADSAGIVIEAVGAYGWLTHPDPNETASWSDVKTLFR